MRAPGRPIREIVGVSPVLTELVTDMVVTRKTLGVTLQEVSEKGNYSISTLSTATSGQCIPSPGVIKAYAEALGVDPERWYALRSRAVKEKRGEAQEESDGGSEPPARPSPPAAPPTGGRTNGPRIRVNMPQISVQGKGLKLIASRDAGHSAATVQESEETGETAVPTRMQQLVAEALEQTNSQLHGNPTANVLSLCTVPADLLELLRETRERNEITFRECAMQLRERGILMSPSSLQRLLQGQELPEAELLHALLAVCNVSREEIRYWLYHRARLELARERQIQRKAKAQRKGRGRLGELWQWLSAVQEPSVSYKVGHPNRWARVTLLFGSFATFAAATPVVQHYWPHF
ncbi:helix-turn-helix transcriptional regulator [Streptomyces fuscichromogenes]|uniref:helix-turn-helix transcriptional regulator n=1 Tax=Streptomyces fuscichromogenes TaxID=1324013 RepID=UPI0037F81A7A